MQKSLDTKPDLSLWPAMEINLECFRVVYPTRDFSQSVLLTSEGLRVTSSVDFAGQEIRFVTNQNAYQRLSSLSLEKKQPSLPVYKLNVYSLAVWGVTRQGER